MLEKIIYLHGKGGTGKSQIIELLQKILKDYYHTLSPHSLYETNFGGDLPRSDLLKLNGPLIIGISEISDAKISSSLIKTLASGESIQCRAQHSRVLTEIKPRGLFIITSNTLPTLAYDSGIKRRIECYECNNEFHNSEKRIPDIGKKIANEEGAIILGHLLSRAASWKAKGGDVQHITESSIVDGWNKRFLDFSDLIGQFLSTETEQASNLSCPVAEFYSRFKEFCYRNGEECITKSRLVEALNERGIIKKKRNDCERFIGVALK